MRIKFVDVDSNLFSLEDCKYEIRIGVERLHNQIIPLKYFREIDKYCSDQNKRIDFETVKDNTISCKVVNL